MSKLYLKIKLYYYYPLDAEKIRFEFSGSAARARQGLSYPTIQSYYKYAWTLPPPWTGNEDSIYYAIT